MSKITKKVYPVMGMHCAACANNVEKIVKKQEGVEDASVNLAAAVLTVDFNSDVVSPEQLKDAVMKIGFDLIIDEDNSMEEQEEAAILRPAVDLHHVVTIRLTKEIFQIFLVGVCENIPLVIGV